MLLRNNKIYEEIYIQHYVSFSAFYTFDVNQNVLINQHFHYVINKLYYIVFNLIYVNTHINT